MHRVIVSREGKLPGRGRRKEAGVVSSTLDAALEDSMHESDVERSGDACIEQDGLGNAEHVREDGASHCPSVGILAIRTAGVLKTD